MPYNDRDLLSELAQRIMRDDPHLADRAKAMRSHEELQPYVAGIQKEMGISLEGFDSGPDEELALETIVVREGRPVLLVENDDYRLEGPESAVWKDRLDLPVVRNVLRKIIPAIGRVEVDNHPTYTWVGTGWLVDKDIIVTNRHVAEIFATRNGTKFVFRKGWPNSDQMSARIDFKEEQNTERPREFKVVDVLYIEDDLGPDIAFLKVDQKASAGNTLAGQLHFAKEPAVEQQFVATIGYPAADSRVPDQDLVRKLFGDVYNVKRMAPGQLLKPRDGLVLHDCSTLGGNSGSPIIDLRTGEAVGLHFSGLFLRENRGVPAAVVKDRLQKVSSGEAISVPAGITDKAPDTSGHNLQAVNRTQSGFHTIRCDVTVPIAVSVNVGTPIFGDQSSVDRTAKSGRAKIEQAVEQAKAQFSQMQGVVSVRDGFVFREGWITDEPAVVVAVRDLEAGTREALGISATISGYSVELRQAGPMDYLESIDLIETLEGFPHTTYEPPDNVTLEPVEDEMKVICHLCPDAGWPTLRDFLSETKKRLTIGMYDFTAPHIVDAVLSATDKQSRKLAMVLQEKASLGGGTKKDDIPEVETIEDYEDKLGDRFEFAWASVGKNHRFASAYHIKVAVRDGKAFWLSSGNWQSSNQPDHEIAKKSDGWNLLMKHNREWNIVIENTDLADQFEAFLKHDLKQATADAEIEAPAVPPSMGFFVEEEPELERVPSGSPVYFEPLVIERSVRVQPLLTPDNYQDHILKLIQSAEEQILFQNQSFSILDDPKNDPRYEAMFNALLDKQEQGVDVRIIIRGDFGPEQIVERLKKRGFDTNRIRLQNRCHTKGIIVDRQIVLVGSHNWTNQGTLVNRDASLIFDDEEIAEYFAKVFWFDWKKLARKSVRSARRVRVVDNLEAPPPAGMVRLSWQDMIS